MPSLTYRRCISKSNIKDILKLRINSKSKSYIFVIDTFEQHQLPVGTLSMSLVLKGPTKLFHRHRYTKDCIQSRAGHMEEETQKVQQRSKGMYPNTNSNITQSW